MPNERARSGGYGKNKSISVMPNFDLVNGRGTEALETMEHHFRMIESRDEMIKMDEKSEI